MTKNRRLYVVDKPGLLSFQKLTKWSIIPWPVFTPAAGGEELIQTKIHHMQSATVSPTVGLCSEWYSPWPLINVSSPMEYWEAESEIDIKSIINFQIVSPEL